MKTNRETIAEYNARKKAEASAFPDALAALEHVKTCSEDGNWAEACALVPELEAALESVLAALAKAKPSA